jgi:protein TonB
VVPAAPPPEPVIQAVQAEPPKAPPVIEPPAPPAPPPAPVVVKQEISVACPGYQAVLAQALEEAVDRVGIVGTVRTLIKVRGSQVVDVVPQSGPREYYKYLQTAVKRMRCSAGGAEEVLVSLDVLFKK